MEVLIINGRRYLINTSTYDGGDSVCEWLLKQYDKTALVEFSEVTPADFTNKIR